MRSILLIIISCFSLMIQAENIDRSSQGGVVRSIHETEIKAQVSGFIERIVDLQESVDKGKNLVKQACAIPRANVSIAQAAVELKSTEKKLKQSMFAQGVIQKADLALADAALKIALSEKKVKREIEKQCNIESPFSGTVVEQYATQGSYISAGDLLLRIVDNTQLYIEFNVQAGDYDYYKPGQKLNVYTQRGIQDNPLLNAVVEKQSEYINKHGTFVVRASIIDRPFSIDKGKTVFAGMRVIIQRSGPNGTQSGFN